MEYQIVSDSESFSAIAFSPDIAVVFYRSDCTEPMSAAYERLKAAYPQIDVIGCSAESLIDDVMPHYLPGRDRQYVFMLLKMPKAHYALTLLESSTFPMQLATGHSALLLTTDNHVGLESMISALQVQLGTEHVYGAIASDHVEFNGAGTLFFNGRLHRTATLIWQIDERVYSLDGQSICTFNPVGISLKITAAEGFKILEIENAPALEVIEKAVGTLSHEGLASFDYPLFIEDYDRGGDVHRRATLASLGGIDREEGSLTLMRRPRVGATLRLAVPVDRKEQKRRIEAAAESFRGCDTAFLFGCRSSWDHWGEMAPILYMHLSRTLECGFFGFHGDGEIGPRPGDISRLQNQSMTLVTLRKRDNRL